MDQRVGIDWKGEGRCFKTGKAILTYMKAKKILKRNLRFKPDREKDDLTLYHCQFCHGWHTGHGDMYRKFKYYLSLKKRQERYGF